MCVVCYDYITLVHSNAVKGLDILIIIFDIEVKLMNI